MTCERDDPRDLPGRCCFTGSSFYQSSSSLSLYTLSTPLEHSILELMTDVAAPETGMHHAATHASTADPPPLTSASASAPAALPLDAANPPHGSQDSSHSRSADTTLNLSSDGSSLNPAAEHHHPDTPPTSDISSQLDSQDTGSPDVPEKKQDTAATQARVIARSVSTSQSPPPTTVSGAKRTASGQVKRSSVNGLADVVSKSSHFDQPDPLGVASNDTGGNVLEVCDSHDESGAHAETKTLQLSQQLRTRLKYAMIKVQHGWQTRSLDEVESLASQSPRSTVSGFQHFHDGPTLLSPRTALARQYQRESSDSESSDSTVALDNHGLANMMGSPQPPSRRALAPPVDILPSSRRRPTPNAAYHGVKGQVHSRQLHSSRPTPSQRTPSQNAAMEADAVETLLFMASPSNSGYNPASQASQESYRSAPAFALPTSPLRTQFSQTSVTSPKRVAFSDGMGVSDAEKAALIDRMLDDLSDESDEELEQAFRLAEEGKPAATVST